MFTFAWKHNLIFLSNIFVIRIFESLSCKCVRRVEWLYTYFFHFKANFMRKLYKRRKWSEILLFHSLQCQLITSNCAELLSLIRHLASVSYLSSDPTFRKRQKLVIFTRCSYKIINVLKSAEVLLPYQGETKSRFFLVLLL